MVAPSTLSIDRPACPLPQTWTWRIATWRKPPNETVPSLIALAQDRTRQSWTSTSSHGLALLLRQMPSSAESMSQWATRTCRHPLTSIPSLFQYAWLRTVTWSTVRSSHAV